MYPLIETTADEFVTRVRTILSQPKSGKRNNASGSPVSKKNDVELDSAVVNSEKLVGGYTADAIVPCAFGLKSNVMYNDEDPFAVALHAFYEMSLFNIFEK